MMATDIPRILEMEAACFPGIPKDRHWKPDMLEAHVARFPDGQFVVEIDGVVVGSATNLRVRTEDALAAHSWMGITGGGYLTTHDDRGGALYGTEVMVHPDHRRKGLGKLLYAARKRYVARHDLDGFVTGGRLPGYGERADEMDVERYVERVTRGELRDRVLTPQLRSGMSVRGVLRGYMVDPPSLDNASLLVWDAHRR